MKDYNIYTFDEDKQDFSLYKQVTGAMILES
jgi:hypothetical protein